ncbi:spore coat protein [Clostridium sp. CF011]|uniref:spore coat protein n=1 Tax=Clostridium sp. CF011 TaxID=2843318 RepID=UPI001C0ABDEA|nr:spore coat protein [Clostridium sp. CF011]MBU3092597.1 spore coat protein [Clostridium sp. CF011]WAG68725.1 spore coat protein [Clostridium sp. CF011]
MAISIYNEFSDYMMFKGIKNVGEIESKNIDVTEEAIIEQFRAIYALHEKSLGFNGYLRNKLNNNTGKIIEDYKISIKKLAGDINNIIKYEPKNSFEQLIVKYGKEVIDRGEQCIREVYQSDYLGIITRSMRRCEICLGNTDFKNIRKNNFIEVVSFKDCSYNMVEMDCFLLLSKLKRKGVKLDFHNLTQEFCYIEGLDTRSSKFLIALISYPHEFMRCCNKHRAGKKNWNEERFSEKLIKALIQDGDSLI